MTRLLAPALLLALAGTCAAQTAPVPDYAPRAPYDWRVLVRVRPSPLLTPAFRDRVLREAEGMLQAELGPLGKVTLLDLERVPAPERELQWGDFLERGFDALSGGGTLTGRKTHFAEWSIDGGTHRLAGRQYDGYTGTYSPVVRRLETRDRALVARLLARVVGKDLGLSGTVERVPGAPLDEVLVRFRASGRVPNFGQWVKPGDVLSLVQLRQPVRRPTRGAAAPTTPPAITSVRQNEVYLVVKEKPKDGAAACKLVWRYDAEPMPRGASVAGYLAVKLGTVEGPVQIRLVDAAGRPIDPSPLRVRVNESAFADKESNRDEAVLRDGLFVSKRPFTGTAFARVIVGSEPRAQVLVPLLQDGPADVAFRLESPAEVAIRRQRIQDAFLARLNDHRVTQIRLFRDLISLERRGRNDEALQRGQSVFDRLKAEIPVLTTELTRLRGQLGTGTAALTNWASLCEQQLRILEAKQSELGGHVEELKRVVQKEKDPTVIEKFKQLDAKQREAENLVRAGDVEKALELYNELLKENENELIRQRRDLLKRQTAVADEAHGKAREYLMEEWPKAADAAALRAAVPKLKDAIAQCRRVDDKLTLLRAELLMPPALDRLNETIQPLLETQEESGLKELESLQGLLKELSEIWKDLSTFQKQSG